MTVELFFGNTVASTQQILLILAKDLAQRLRKFAAPK